MGQHRLSAEWNDIVVGDRLEMCYLLEDIYFCVLQYYKDFRWAMPLYTVAQKYGRRWNTLSKTVLRMQFLDLMRLAELSQTIPIYIGVSHRNSHTVLPTAAVGTNYAMLRTKSDEYVDADAFMAGELEGPALRGKGLARADSPFPEPPASAPAQ